MFRTQYELEKRSKIKSNPGTPEVNIYGSELENSVLTVKPKGTRDQRAYINSFAEEADMHVIINRFMNGDKDALLKRAGAYIDVSNMPTSLAEFTQLYTQLDSLFDTLPFEVKEKFNNNPLQYIVEYGTDSWKDKMDTSAAAEKAKADDLIKAKAKESSANAEIKYNSVYGDQTPIKEEVIQETPVKSSTAFDFKLKGNE